MLQDGALHRLHDAGPHGHAARAGDVTKMCPKTEYRQEPYTVTRCPRDMHKQVPYTVTRMIRETPVQAGALHGHADGAANLRQARARDHLPHGHADLLQAGAGDHLPDGEPGLLPSRCR